MEIGQYCVILIIILWPGESLPWHGCIFHFWAEWVRTAWDSSTTTTPSSPFHSQKGSWQGIGDWSRANYWWRCYHLLLWWIYQLVYLPTSSGSNQNNHFHGLARLSSFLSWASVWGGSLFVQSKYQDDTEWCQKESYTSIPSILESSKTQIQLELVPYYVASLFLPSVVGLHFPHTDQKPAHYFTRRLQIVP